MKKVIFSSVFRMTTQKIVEFQRCEAFKGKNEKLFVKNAVLRAIDSRHPVSE